MYDPDDMPAPRWLEGEAEVWPEAYRRKHYARRQGTLGGHEDIGMDAIADDEWRRVRAFYYSMITLIDVQVGRLVETLRRQGMLEETVIVFTSDHGEMLGDHHLVFKGTTFDEVTGVPLIVTRPGEMQAGAVSIDLTTGTLDAGASVVVTLTIDRDRVTADGDYAFDVPFEVDGLDVLLPVTFSRGSAVLGPSGPLRVIAYVVDGAGGSIATGAWASEGFADEFEVEVSAGEHRVLAWYDENRNGVIDAGDFFGRYPDPVRVEAGQAIEGIDIEVAPWGEEPAAPPAAASYPSSSAIFAVTRSASRATSARSKRNSMPAAAYSSSIGRVPPSASMRL
jgi:hypothetical protein